MVFHVLNPLLFIYTHVMPKVIGPLYRTFGIPGIMALPWITLALEKASYDTLAAARGYDLQAEHAKKGNPHGEFPSGGAALPSWSLIPMRGEEDRLIISILGDKPRQVAAAAASSGAEQ